MKKLFAILTILFCFEAGMYAQINGTNRFQWFGFARDGSMAVQLHSDGSVQFRDTAGVWHEGRYAVFGRSRGSQTIKMEFQSHPDIEGVLQARHDAETISPSSSRLEVARIRIRETILSNDGSEGTNVSFGLFSRGRTGM